MASIAIMIGGAILNATAFVGGSYLAKSLSGSSTSEITAERKRHDLALERYQKDTTAWEKQRKNYQDWLSENYQNKLIADKNFADTDSAFKLYAAAHPTHSQNALHRPSFHNYYQPSEKQKNAELLFVGLGGLAMGGAVAYLV